MIETFLFVSLGEGEVCRNVISGSYRSVTTGWEEVM